MPIWRISCLLRDTALWVEYGNGLSGSDDLAAKKIKYVLPLDGEGTYIPGIHREDPAKRLKYV